MRLNRRIWLACLGGLCLAVTASQVGCQRAKPPAKPAKSSPKPAAEPTEKPAPEPAVKPAAVLTVKSAPELLKVPLGLPALPVPDDNPMTLEKVELGKLLYFDKRVSKDGAVSCATCHDPKMAWTEHEPTSTGINDAEGHPQVGQRNSPTVINAAYATSQFWDGREPTLEKQAVGPVGNPIEMGHSMEAVMAAFSKIPGYQQRFQKVFGADVTVDGFAKAIAAFERTVLSGNSPYDKYTENKDDTALTEAQKRGLELFKEDCATCHAPPLFSNYRFYNAGVGMDAAEPDKGLMAESGKDRDLGKFRVPALREVEKTYPYFHDGSVQKIEDAVALMAAGGKDHANLSAAMKAVRLAELSDADQKDLVEFLKSLSGEYPIVDEPQQFPE